jgi:SSS family solute:Na+ symporter
MYFKVAPSNWLFTDVPFMNQMGITLLITLFIIFLISYFEGNKNNPKGIELSKKLFETSPSFNIAAMIICIITAFFYALLW